MGDPRPLVPTTAKVAQADDPVNERRPAIPRRIDEAAIMAAAKANQEAFRDSLNEDEKDLLSFYTFHGDELINTYLRGNYTPQDKFNRWIRSDNLLVKIFNRIAHKIGQSDISDITTPASQEMLIPEVISEMHAILGKAPVMKAGTTVYRGIISGPFKVCDFLNAGFLSTSTNYDVAQTFVQARPGKRLILFIKLKQDTRCIYMEYYTKVPGEEEVLFDTHSGLSCEVSEEPPPPDDVSKLYWQNATLSPSTIYGMPINLQNVKDLVKQFKEISMTDGERGQIQAISVERDAGRVARPVNYNAPIPAAMYMPRATAGGKRKKTKMRKSRKLKMPDPEPHWLWKILMF